MADDPFRAEIRAILDDLQAGVLFLTRIPARFFGPADGSRPDFRRAARAFPAVGLVVGAVGGVVLIVARDVGESPLVAAGLAVLATFLLTGGLHEDGLADTADGFGGGATPERKLEIMDDSRVGTFGAAALVFSILLRVAALTSLTVYGSWRAAPVLVAAETVSRAAMVRLWHALPAARMGGLAHDTGPPDQTAMLIALAIAAVVVVVTVIPSFGFWAAVVGSLLAVGVTYGVTLLTASQIGGRTGDTLGACQQVAAIAFLIGVAAF